MKKFISVLHILLCIEFLSAQNDTLLYMNFNEDPYPFISSDFYPPGSSFDTAWYNIDLDQLTPIGANDGIGTAWFWSQVFANSDTIEFINCMAARSWFEEIGKAKNYLITPAIPIADSNAILSWRSAPFQTPRYLDGYKVLISNTTNDIEAFTDTVFIAAEMTQLAPPSDTSGNFAAYQFSPGFIHGADGQYLEPTNSAMRKRGKLRPFSFSLANYANSFIFIAFYHDSDDDNLISIDEVLVTGTYDPNFGLTPTSLEGLKGKVFPNPAHAYIHLELNAVQSLENVLIELLDVQGQVLFSEKIRNLHGIYQKSIHTLHIPPGFYALRLSHTSGVSVFKFIKQ